MIRKTNDRTIGDIATTFAFEASVVTGSVGCIVVSIDEVKASVEEVELSVEDDIVDVSSGS